MSRDEDATAATKRDGIAAGGRPDRTIVDDKPAGAEAEERLPPGTHLGRYVVAATLGAGGMGVVYAAFDPELDRKVAIKLLQARPGGSETGGQTWLIREAKAMARLAHPNVVAVYDVGNLSGDRVWVAMELVEGVTLRDWLKTDRRWREVWAVMRAAGQGLEAAHAAGLVHRDFKPDNVLVGHDGRTRVMDFGLARLQGTEVDVSAPAVESHSPLSERLTATGTVLGTPAYMAPEIYGGHGSDARADQFAFGVAFYEALYRRRPFERAALVEKRATAPKPPSSNVPAWLERVVLRALSLDPEKRYPSMTDLLAELVADPTARRRQLAIGGGLVAVGVVVATLAMRGQSSEAVELCTGAEAQLVGVWDASTRGAVETTFRKSNVDDTLKATTAALDRYAADWVAMRGEACKATRVLGHQSEDVMTLRMQCLDLRRAELQTLTKLFAAADQSLVQGAVTSVNKLGALGDCADVAALTAPDPLPKDPAARDTAVRIGAKLAEARVVYKLSRPKDAAAILDTIDADVTRLNHRPTTAQYRFLRGQTLWVTAGADQGEPMLLEAANAAEAGKVDELQAEAWLQLANIAIEGGKFDVAKERWQQASATLARLGGKWEMEVRVIASRALSALRQSKHADAIATIQEARAIVDKHRNTPSYAYALLVQAAILNASARPKEALDNFREILAYHETTSHNRMEILATVGSMATANAQLGQVDKAIEYAKRAVETAESIYGKDSSEVARQLSTLGATQSLTNDHATALATQKRALELAKRTVGEADQLYTSLLGQLASSLVSLGKPKEAIPYLDRAEAASMAKMGPGHLETLSIGLTKCDALRAAKDLRAALAVCERVIAAGETSLGKSNPLLFLFLGHYGELLLDARKFKAAAATLDRALKLGGTDPAGLYLIAFLAGRAHWEAGDRKAGIELATKARDGYKSLGEPGRDATRQIETWIASHGGGRRKR